MTLLVRPPSALGFGRNPPWRAQALKITALLAFTTFSIAVHALDTTATGLNGKKSLEHFVKTAQSGRAMFTQVVTSPAKEGQAAKTKTSTGTFEFLRPNRFKFIYKKPFEQSIVADGQTLWLYDVDLNQVTARKLAQVLTGTPAAVIAAAADLKGLQADFVLKELPASSGLQQVQATPKTKDGQLQSITLGFKSSDKLSDKVSELATLEILDSFGQRSVMTFTGLETNPTSPTVTASSFAFTPPAGAAVSRP